MATPRTLRAISGAALAGALVLASSPTAAADDVRDAQWPLSKYDSESIWKVTKGKGQTVAVIDDGVNANHVDLKGNILDGKDFVDGGTPTPGKGDFHGTAMAGVIAGHGHGAGGVNGTVGLAPEAKILPLRDGTSSVNGFDGSIRYAVDHGASVINISSAGNAALESGEGEAIAYALKHDVLVVAGTGNTGGSVQYPAAYPGVLAVGGVTSTDRIWPKSNTGSKTLLTGPASKIPHAGSATDPDGYGRQGGTSYATAYASASAALVRAKFPELSAGQVANRLTETAVLPDSEKGLKLPDEKYGYGSIRPLAALTEDVPKGSKYGPLSVPESISKGDSKKEVDAGQEQADQKALMLQIAAGVVVLVFIAVIILVVVLVRRKKKNRSNGPGGPNGPGMPGGPGGYPGPGYGYGQPPHQQQPGQQSPPPQSQQPPRY